MLGGGPSYTESVNRGPFLAPRRPSAGGRTRGDGRPGRCRRPPARRPAAARGPRPGPPAGRPATSCGRAGAADHLYLYRIYGLHTCANVTCGPAGEPAAVLLRAG
ncbi:DNA-3-methyladenine glycosylase, partial [Micromonospora carbonacea]|uniref:DNA-3-methyladenine glycosylase n=1 Tax=Micromonospora carbonacea TaxID=47853 RepID=UPI003F4D30E5